MDDRDWDPVVDPHNALLDIDEQTIEFADRIAHFLGVGPVEIPEFELATWDSAEETVGEMARRYGAEHKSLAGIISALRARQPAFIGPYGIYLHDFSLNDLADLAARLVLRSLAWEKPFARTRNAYYADITYEALVYFATKVINPKRTCKRESDLADWESQERMKRLPSKLSRQLAGVVGGQVWPHLEMLRKALDAGDPELFKASRSWWQSPLQNRFQASRMLGNRLGERLFYSVQVGLSKKQVKSGHRRRVTRGRMSKLLLDPASACADARACYLKLWFDMADVVEHHQERAKWF